MPLRRNQLFSLVSRSFLLSLVVVLVPLLAGFALVYQAGLALLSGEILLGTIFGIVGVCIVGVAWVFLKSITRFADRRFAEFKGLIDSSLSPDRFLEDLSVLVKNQVDPEVKITGTQGLLVADQILSRYDREPTGTELATAVALVGEVLRKSLSGKWALVNSSEALPEPVIEYTFEGARRRVNPVRWAFHAFHFGLAVGTEYDLFFESHGEEFPDWEMKRAELIWVSENPRE